LSPDAELFFAGQCLWNGIVFKDRTREVMKWLCSRSGLIWFFDNNILHVYAPNQSQPMPPTIISSNTGLLDTPEITEHGGISFKTWLNPKLAVWTKHTLQAALLQELLTPGGAAPVSRLIKITDVEHVGDTHGSEWFSTAQSYQLGT